LHSRHIKSIDKPILLNDTHVFQVHEFCDKCRKLNYVNNLSFAAMKWDFATWFAHFINDKIVSLSGVHEFLDGYRVMFRGATLPGTANRILNKDQAYAQMDYINNIHGESIFYFTLNCDDNTGVKSNRLRKYVRSGKGWPGSEYIRTDIIYGVNQEIWKINEK